MTPIAFNLYRRSRSAPMRLAALLFALTALTPASLWAITPNGQFPSTPVAGTSVVVELTFTLPAATTLAATPYTILSRGAANLDFVAATTQSATKCAPSTAYAAGATCTVDVVFTPKYPGLRIGAVQLLSSGGVPVATLAVSGVATGPEVTFPTPGAVTKLGSGFNGFGQSTGPQFQGPSDTAVDANGNVYVADWGSLGVYEIIATNGRVSPSSTIIPLGSAWTGPSDLTIDAAGDVLVSDSFSHNVYKITATNGSVSSTSPMVAIGSGFSVPQGLVVDGLGNVFVADYGNFAVYEIVATNGAVSATSTVTKIADIANYPVGIALDAAGDLYVGSQDGRVVQIVAVNGSVSSASIINLIGTYSDARGLAVDAAGDLYISDDGANAVYERIAQNGTVTSTSPQLTLATGLGSPRSLSIDQTGNLFVAGRSANLVYEFDYADPPSFSFAKTAIGATSTDSPQSTTIANIGNADLLFTPQATPNPSVSSDWAVNPSTTTCPSLVANASTSGHVASAARCVYGFNFTPLHPGTLTGASVLTDNAGAQTIPLSGTATGPSLSIAPATISFPATAVGNTSAALTATITNSGTAAIYLSSGSLTDSTDFTQSDNCSGLVSSNSSCTVTFSFKPQSTGTLTSTYAIHDLNNPASPLNVALSGNATGAPQALFSPSSLTFTTVVNTQAYNQTLTLTNSGNAALSIASATIGGASASQFSIVTNTCGSSLANGANCAITVDCTAIVYGSYAGTLTLTSNATPSTQSVPLTCNVNGSASATLTPSSSNFGSITAGKTTAATVFTLTSTGNIPLSLTSVALSGTNASSFTITANTCGPSLAVNANCSISVIFAPSAVGTFAATLTATNAAGSQTSTLTGTATPVTPPDFTLAATPAAQTTYHGQSATYTVQLASLLPANPFTTAVNLSVTGLPPGATAAFSPATVTPGTTSPTTQLTVTIPALSAANHAAPHANQREYTLITLAGLLVPALFKQRRLRGLLGALTLTLLACGTLSLSGCGDGNGFATPTATYSLVITGTSGSTTHATTVSLTVK